MHNFNKTTGHTLEPDYKTPSGFVTTQKSDDADETKIGFSYEEIENDSAALTKTSEL